MTLKTTSETINSLACTRKYTRPACKWGLWGLQYQNHIVKSQQLELSLELLAWSLHGASYIQPCTNKPQALTIFYIAVQVYYIYRWCNVAVFSQACDIKGMMSTLLACPQRYILLLVSYSFPLTVSYHLVACSTKYEHVALICSTYRDQGYKIIWEETIWQGSTLATFPAQLHISYIIYIQSYTVKTLGLL